ncbi:ribose-phosphate pyrophosphokinase [Candidatus Woesearchaeota archaeon]|nr:ribose-phosphate pyrophosphokinase [Candidatus Woesearchaeota archaeon]
MASKTKLLIIPCSGKETSKLAKDIFDILKSDYGLEDQVELLDSSRRSQIPPGTLKDNRHPLVTDFFPDMEVQVDIGRNDLKDVIRGKHIALVEHLLTPNSKASANDHIMNVRGMLDIVSKTETLKRTLVAPYLSYIRSHSIEKYEARGFYQFDSLRKTLQDYQKDGLNAILTIDPHSDKAEQIAKQLGIDYHWINPFQSARAINPAKLGLSGEKAELITKRLRPFQEKVLELKKQYPLLYFVSLDNGTEKRVENFVERAYPDLSIAEVYARIAYFDKDRVAYENSTAAFKNFSIINENNFDPNGVYIQIDDMLASGGTSNKVAKVLKESKAKRVELWASHAVTTSEQIKNANDRSYIDHIVSLDTIPQHPDLNLEYISASAHLLSGELYKAHQRLTASR